MSKPKYDRIISKFEAGENFTLTRQQYLNYTGADIPQSKSYTENKSGIAKKAQKYGYKITVVPEKLIFEKKENNNKEI